MGTLGLPPHAWENKELEHEALRAEAFTARVWRLLETNDAEMDWFAFWGSTLLKEIHLPWWTCSTARTCALLRTFKTLTVVLKIIQPLLLFPMTSIVNKSRNIDRCVNSMLLINQNMIVSQGLEHILSMFRRTGRTTISGQHPLI